jgi:HPr kinase/phosphorylase
LQVHGTLVQVLGVGVLLRGRSGIGKSEIALELVARGHQLVADDVVVLHSDASETPKGSAPPLIRHHLEIRGIGLLDVPDLFGPQAIADEAPVGLLIRLEDWRPDAQYERVGLEREVEELLGASVPSLLLPVRPSGNMATLVEVAVRDHLRRPSRGSAAQRLDARLRAEGSGS